MFIHTTLLNIDVEVIAMVIQREIKGIQIGKEGVKLSLFADDMILYIENPRDATRKLPKRANEFGKIARYKMQGNLLHFYTLTMKDQKEKLK